MMMIVAHRGYSRHYPENTLLAFQKAIEAGCDGIELDVQMTKDGELVVLHDETLERTTTGQGLLQDQVADRVKILNAGKLFPQYGFVPVPLLAQCLELVQSSGIYAILELKNNVLPYVGMEEKVIALVRKYDLTHRIILSSFHGPSLEKCRQMAPEIPTALLTRRILFRPGAFARRSGAAYLHVRHTVLTRGQIREIQATGVKVHVWTVNDPRRARMFLRSGVYGLITDDPENLVALRNAFR